MTRVEKIKFIAKWMYRYSLKCAEAKYWKTRYLLTRKK
jgi:hypothetical protein